MRTLLLILALLGTVSISAGAERDVKWHTFEFWGVLDKAGEPPNRNSLKLAFFYGFTNGFFSGVKPPMCKDGRPAVELMRCLTHDQRLSTPQAIAMIDKFYRENPAKWSMPVADAIIEALTVSDGPCAAARP